MLHNHSPVRVTGGVTGKDGMALPRATIWITGTSQQKGVTNAAGDFILVWPNTAPVTLRCGYSVYYQKTTTLQLPGAHEGVFFELEAAAGRRKP